MAKMEVRSFSSPDEVKQFEKGRLEIVKIGKFVGITLWDTEKNLQASAAAADRLRAQGTKTAGTAKPPTVEIYEVAVQT